MSFAIQYQKGGVVLAECVWPTEIPPPRAFTRLAMKRRGADTVIIRDSFGREVAVINDPPAGAASHQDDSGCDLV
jgi:hypothetical protein